MKYYMYLSTEDPICPKPFGFDLVIWGETGKTYRDAVNGFEWILTTSLGSFSEQWGDYMPNGREGKVELTKEQAYKLAFLLDK